MNGDFNAKFCKNMLTSSALCFMNFNLFRLKLVPPILKKFKSWESTFARCFWDKSVILGRPNGHCQLSPETLWDLDVDLRTRGHRFKIRSCRGQVDARTRFFSHRVIKYWNELPGWLAEETSLSQFKNGLSTVLGDRLYEYHQWWSSQWCRVFHLNEGTSIATPFHPW